MKSVEIQSKTIDEAITKGCAELGVGLDEVDFDVIEEGGLFRKMKVRISLKEKQEAPQSLRAEQSNPEPIAEPVEYVIEGQGRKERKPRVERPERPVTEFDAKAPKFVKTLEFAKKFFELMDEKLKVTTEHNDHEFIIAVNGEEVSRLIGKEGKTLAAINTIVSSVAINNSNGEPRRVLVDIENYRAKRMESLKTLAQSKADYVRESGKTVKLEPMPARERVIIHTALQDMEGIKTYSVGDEPHRYLVIEPSAR